MLDGERIIKTFRRQQVDRVAIHENAFNSRLIKYVTDSDCESSLDLSAPEYKKIADFGHWDLVTVGYMPPFRGSQINTREQFKNWLPHCHENFLKRVDSYIDFFKGSGIGVNVYIHGHFDATYLAMGYESFFYVLHDDKILVEKVMDYFTEDALILLSELLKRDLATIEVIDDVAFKNGPFVSPKVLAELWLVRLRKLSELVHSKNIPLFFHSDGDAEYYIKHLIELGFHGVNPIEPDCNDIYHLKKKYGKDIVLMGNVDVGGVLNSGSLDDVKKAVKGLVEDMKKDGGYIAMSSSSISDSVIPENYKMMVETVLEYGKY